MVCAGNVHASENETIGAICHNNCNPTLVIISFVCKWKMRETKWRKFGMNPTNINKLKPPVIEILDH